MRPRIVQTDGQIGFYWATPDGVATTLADLVIDDEEPDRLVATHLEALDDALIIAAAQFGTCSAAASTPIRANATIWSPCTAAWICWCAITHWRRDRRHRPRSAGGQDHRHRRVVFDLRPLPLDLLGPAPFDGELDEPSLGVRQRIRADGAGRYREAVEGRPVDPEIGIRPTISADIVDDVVRQLRGEQGRRPTRTPRGDRTCIATAVAPDADPFTVACALDWLLYDWLMAHREDPDSAAIQIPKGHDSDAG